MKSRSNPIFRPASFVAALALACTASQSHAAQLFWDGTDTTANADGGSGTWNTTTTNWDTATTGGTSSAWTTLGNTDVANFGGTGGTVTLGANLGPTGAYPNSINVTAGNYVIDQAGFDLSFRGSAITVSSGATLEIKGGTIPLQNNGSLAVNSSNALKISSKITNTTGIAVVKTGGGDVTLTNDTNDFTGNLSGQNGGNLSISSIKNSGVASAAGAGSIVATGINNVIVYTGTGDSTNRTFSLFGSGDDTLKNNGTSGALVWTGAFANTKTSSSFLRFSGTNTATNEFRGNLVNNGANILSVSKEDVGTWQLSGNNSFTGATAVSAGTLIANHANALGSTTGSTSVTGNAQLILTGGIAVGAEALTLNSGATASWNGQTGAALRNFSGTNSWAGTIALGQNTSIATNSGSALTVSGAISGGFNLTKADSGTLTLSGANTYTGTTTIAAGTLQANRADVAAVSGALGNGGNITFTGGTLQYTTNSAATNYSSRIVNSSAAIKIDTAGQNVTFGTALANTNTAGLIKEGAGQLELKMSAASYTGTTTINGGTLKFAATADLDFLSSPSFNINNGATMVIYSDFNRTTISNGKTFTFGNSGGGSIVYDKGNHLMQSSAGKFVTTGGTQNTISGLNGGFINPQNSNTVNFEVADGTDAVDLLVSVPIGSGNYTKSGAGTLSITSFSNLGGGTAQPNLTINAGIFDVGGPARLTTVGQSVGVVTSDILNNGVYRHSSSNIQTLSGVMSGTGGLTQNGSGTLTLSGSNTYSGATTVSVGTLSLGHATNTLSSSSAVTVDGATAVLAIAGNSDTVGSVSLKNGASITGTGGTLTGASYAVESGSVSAILGGADVALTKSTAGTVTLSGSNSYTGTTTVNAGTLSLGHATNTLSSSSAVRVDGATAVLTIAGNSDTVGAVSLKNGGSITGTGGTLTGASYAVESGSVSAILGGTDVALTKSTAGTVTLSAANTFTGATTVAAGKLKVNGSTSANSAVGVSSGGILGGSGTVGGNTTLASGGTLAPGNSPGVLTVSGATTFSSGSIFEWELDTAQSNPTTNRGSAYDGLNTTAVTGSGAIFRIMLTGTQDFTDTFWDQTRIWEDIFKSTGGSTNLEGWAAVFSGGFQYAYNGQSVEPNSSGSFTLSGNSLTWSAVPEPSSALTGLLIVAVLLRRRRTA